jgi:hypothetical protein
MNTLQTKRYERKRENSLVAHSARSMAPLPLAALSVTYEGELLSPASALASLTTPDLNDRNNASSARTSGEPVIAGGRGTLRA